MAFVFPTKYFADNYQRRPQANVTPHKKLSPRAPAHQIFIFTKWDGNSQTVKNEIQRHSRCSITAATFKDTSHSNDLSRVEKWGNEAVRASSLPKWHLKGRKRWLSSVGKQVEKRGWHLSLCHVGKRHSHSNSTYWIIRGPSNSFQNIMPLRCRISRSRFCRKKSHCEPKFSPLEEKGTSCCLKTVTTRAFIASNDFEANSRPSFRVSFYCPSISNKPGLQRPLTPAFSKVRTSLKTLDDVPARSFSHQIDSICSAVQVN